MNLKKKLSLLELRQLTFNFNTKPKAPIALCSSTRYSNTQRKIGTGVNKTESSIRRTNELELDKLIKLQHNLKRKLLFCKDETTETMMTKCFKNINKRIKTIADGQFNDTNTNTNGVTMTNSKNEIRISSRYNSNKDNNKTTQDEYEHEYGENVFNDKDMEEHNRLYKQMIQLENINKDIELLDLNANENFIQDLPKHFFIREKILRQSHPVFKSKTKKIKQGLNLTINPIISYIKTNGALVKGKSNTHSHKTLLTKSKLNVTKQSNKGKAINLKTQNMSNTKRNVNDTEQRPYSSNITRQNSFLKNNTIKAKCLINEASTIQSNMQFISNSIQSQYYSNFKGKGKSFNQSNTNTSTDTNTNTNTKDNYYNHLMSLYNIKEANKKSLSLNKTHQRKDNSTSPHTNLMEKQMIQTLSTIPSLIKNTFRQTFKTILYDHKLLNKPTEYIPNPYEQRKFIRRLNRDFNKATKKKLLLLQSVNGNGNDYNQYNQKTKDDELTAPPKDNNYINLNELEWLLIKRRVLKPNNTHYKNKKYKEYNTIQ